MDQSAKDGRERKNASLNSHGTYLKVIDTFRQRLVRKVCKECRHPVELTDQELRDAAIAQALPSTATFYEAMGCDACNNTGYRGRSAIVELLEMNDEQRDMIVSKTPAVRLKQVTREQGTVFLREAAVEKLCSVDTTIKEINRVTFVE